jgi:hypothetical protein
MATLARIAWRMLEDWGWAPFRAEPRRAWLAILDDRHAGRATLVTSPFPGAHWHAALGAPTLADALRHRLVPLADTLTVQSDSRRKRPARLTRGAAGAEP